MGDLEAGVQGMEYHALSPSSGLETGIGVFLTSLPGALHSSSSTSLSQAINLHIGRMS
jgi:hypothetical protein